jgi:predicted MFS family arabinose efflux permease
VPNHLVLRDNAAVLRSPDAARVLAASLIGRLPSGSAPLALLLFARETMTIAVAGLLVGAYTAGAAVGQPMLARAADRWRQPPVVWVAVTASTIGFVLTAANIALPVTVSAAALAGLGAPPFEACLRALWRDIVADPLLHTAYTLDVTAQELIFVIGPVLTLGAVAGFGPTGGLLATALLQLTGALWFATTPAVRRWRGEPAPRHWAGPLRSAGIRLLLATTVLVGAGVGSIAVAVTGYAEQVGARSWSGWLLAAQAGGALIGGLVYARFRSGDARRNLPRITALMAVAYLPPLLTPAPPAMLILVAVGGLSLPAFLTTVFVCVDGDAPPGTAAESFAWVATAFMVGSAGGAALDGMILDTTSTATAGFVLAPLTIAFAAAVAASRRSRGVDASAGPRAHVAE